ncbi:MAG TPA: carboxypeptidase-like regulatory domain-containing protein [Blastocatellia bacterium]|nr:carboxypeptidase-like regulatory domain-containing protein [Blastocatellia bacterium]
MFCFKRVLLLAAGVCLSSASSYSQTSSTALSGTVYDPSGAIVAGASVTAANDATGVAFRQTTNESGLYSFRLEAFNALNHTNYRGLNNATVGSLSIISPNFGTACCQSLATSTSTAIVSNGEAYRVVQAVLKIGF